MDHPCGPGPWTPYFSDQKKGKNNTNETLLSVAQVSHNVLLKLHVFAILNIKMCFQMRVITLREYLHCSPQKCNVSERVHNNP